MRICLHKFANFAYLRFVLTFSIRICHHKQMRRQFQVHGTVHRCNNLNKIANQMYFVLKILKILFTLFRSTCFGHHCVHHQELFSCTCSLWSRVVLGSLVLGSLCPPEQLQHSRTGGHNEPSTTRDRLHMQSQRTKNHTGPETACAAEKLLMMDTMVSETCRAE